jgi:hypothetical protein
MAGPYLRFGVAPIQGRNLSNDRVIGGGHDCVAMRDMVFGIEQVDEIIGHVALTQAPRCRILFCATANYNCSIFGRAHAPPGWMAAPARASELARDNPVYRALRYYRRNLLAPTQPLTALRRETQRFRRDKRGSD